MDSAQSDQWIRHLQRALTRPDDYWLSVLQWQFGWAANLMTVRGPKSLMPDERPHDVPREPAALFGPWLKGLRQFQEAIRELRRQLHAAHLARRTRSQQPFPFPFADWMKWVPPPTAAKTLPQFPGPAEGIQAAIAAMMRENKHIT